MRATKPTFGLALGLLALCMTDPAFATETDAQRQTRWQDLRHAVFGERAVEDGAGVVTLDAPERALDAALVPVTITLADPQKIKSLTLLIDENPSPVAGSFHFGPAADAEIIRTRVRVDQYTLMHAIAETKDGQLYVATRFVKAAGGCSAPATSNATLAAQRIGQMKLRMTDQSPVNAAAATREAILLISHPNANGMQMDQVSRNYIPARYIQTIKVMRGDALVFDFDADISLSEDPAIIFRFRPEGATTLDVEVRDSSSAVFKHQFDIGSKGS
jgi:sulfur-oxidizing protein SoxY